MASQFSLIKNTPKLIAFHLWSNHMEAKWFSEDHKKTVHVLTQSRAMLLGICRERDDLCKRLGFKGPPALKNGLLYLYEGIIFHVISNYIEY